MRRSRAVVAGAALGILLVIGALARGGRLEWAKGLAGKAPDHQVGGGRALPVALWIDGEPAQLRAADLSRARRPLAELVPPRLADARRWTVLRASAGDGKHQVEVARPATAFPDLVPSLFEDSAGVSFGLLTAAGAVKMHVAGVRRIDILTTAPKEEANADDEPTHAPVPVRLPDGGSVELTVETLEAVEPIAPSGEGDRPAWPLARVIGAVAPGVAYDQIELVDGPVRLSAARAEVADEHSWQLKLNNAGKLRVRRGRDGGGRGDGSSRGDGGVRAPQIDDLKEIVLSTNRVAAPLR